MNTTSKTKLNLDDSRLYINRELSWLSFNERVLEMAERQDVPPMERLKFLAIFSSNLDEFFMIRVAGLMQRMQAGIQGRDPSGLTTVEQLDAVRQKTLALTARHAEAAKTLITLLQKHGLYILNPRIWNSQQRRFIRDYFQSHLLPLLTPIAAMDPQSFPLLPNLQLHIGITLSAQTGEEKQIIVIPVPTIVSRFVALPSREGEFWVTIEDVLIECAGMIVRGKTIESVDLFRITRDADVKIQEEEAGDLLETIEAAVLERRHRQAVRVELSAHCSSMLQDWIFAQFQVGPQQIYPIEGIPDLRCLWELVGRGGFDSLRWPEWPAQYPADLAGFESIWDAVSNHDVMLFHPYESFEPVVEWIRAAAEDPAVLAIKQTLYRTSPESPVISALEQAARSGKEVTVLVELKARFEETRNVRWARRLEDAGCYVVYGVAGLKTHAKALMIIRREAGRIKRYVHLSTGNYNEKTSRLYSDIGLITCEPQLTLDVGAFFNLLTGFSESVGWSKLTIAPTSLRQRMLDLIEREIKLSSPNHPGLIMIKANSLEDIHLCQALYRASAAGVRIKLNIRGICCLRPSVKGVSDQIEVISILDRYLEHARIYYFDNGGHPEVYLSSADMMGRNLDRRLELLFPITQPELRQRLSSILETYFSDTIHAWQLGSDGVYQRIMPEEKSLRSQQSFYEQVADAAGFQKARFRFRPIRSSDK
ncbi:MAG: polyphosphate kinase 1 [Sedimentisphaerales bacterium]|nr:polyphosphate kinase 1 [Sedimentisphaerales bacterium]